MESMHSKEESKVMESMPSKEGSKVMESMHRGLERVHCLQWRGDPAHHRTCTWSTQFFTGHSIIIGEGLCQNDDRVPPMMKNEHWACTCSPIPSSHQTRWPG